MDVANFFLARHLARRGHEVHLVAHGVAEELSREPNVQVHRVPRPLEKHALGRPLLDVVGRTVGAKVAARGGRVLVNGGNCRFGDVCWVHYVHAAWAPPPSGNRMQVLRRAVQRKGALKAEHEVLSAARLVLANSERTKSELVVRLGLDASRVRVVYLGSEPERFSPPSEKERQAARAQLALPSGARVVAFIGAFGDRRKGFDTLYEAWKRLCASPDFNGVLLAAGAGAELEGWKARAREEGLEGRVRLLGYHADVAGLLAAADALVAPSRYEAFGVAVLEALCRGRPAWVSRAAGVSERYPAALAELLLPDADDAADLAGRLRGWYEAPDRHREAIVSLSEALRGYTWDDMAREIADLLEGEAGR